MGESGTVLFEAAVETDSRDATDIDSDEGGENSDSHSDVEVKRRSPTSSTALIQQGGQALAEASSKISPFLYDMLYEWDNEAAVVWDGDPVNDDHPCKGNKMFIMAILFTSFSFWLSKLIEEINIRN